GIDWLADHLKQTQQTPVRRALSLSGSSGVINIPLPTENSAWVLDYISAPEINDLRTFSSFVKIPRITALTSGICFLVFTTLYFTTPLSVLLIFLLVIAIGCVNRWVFIYCYRQDSVVAEREAILTREKRETRLLDSLQRSLKDMQSKKKYLFAEETKKKSGLLRQISDLQVRKQSEKEKLDAKLRQRINSINNSRLVLNRGEADELRKIQQTFGYEINRLNKQISSLAQAESDEILRTLQAKQKQFLADYLSKYRIIDADISGVGDKLKSRLRASAIFTAADIEYWRVTSVEGIGSNKGNALVRWRDSLVARARGQMSTSLTQSEVNTIKKRYELQKHQLENQRDE